ncbi:LysM peptidoglycan-binding domain-containing protein [Altererythrobacter salegens]|uniref:LysM peptidoglycan-binding domain-containing protein n=1 Tax=Croceibacterium salegens TaxID=1737568 RepID=A0A6I4SXZ9_9SPHN|nr:M23 family metallopeptidase [Croceibacterium salegens]MXO60895.1 LysM peptidoglycan-binding domain-containing protein [Croceibacterium salegens]
MIRTAVLPLAALLLVAASDPATETEHVVEEGETLKGIANRAGVPDSVIAEANGIAAPYVVKLGQKLVIPRQRSHAVKSGETLGGIAQRYSVPASDIALANGLDSKGTVKVGQKLIIPAVLPARDPVETPAEPYFNRPHDGKVILGWKRRPDGGGHAGLDVAVGTGDMIRASASGIVISVGDDKDHWGKLVVIDHGNGWQSLYGELARATVAVGDAVKTGERVGIGGRDGEAAASEFHFEIRRGGQPVDPTPLLRLDKR